MAKRGRPLKYTEDKADDAIEAAEKGMPVNASARAAGVWPKTIENWLDKSLDDDCDKIPVSFFQRFMRARFEGEKKLHDRAEEKEHASFEQFLLSTSFKYKKTEKKELTGEDGGPVQVDTIIEVMRDAREEEK